MKAKRVLVVLAAAFGVLLLCWVVLIGAVYAWSGVATVRVKDPAEGVNLFIPVPMAAVEAAVATSTWVIPRDEWLELDVELGEWQPMVTELLAVLEEMPDATLVEVEDASTFVRVRKQHGALKVEVDDGDISIRVSVPTRSVLRTVNRLAASIS